ncbi:YrrS family protein [Alkalihalobacillus sp. 1P02AB]|uniref:YrrS family protein n=1 Tax=Alkalihalobacillus sp. 1P02AB TaxID=3132260 RepID=UPI0039A5F979
MQRSRSDSRKKQRLNQLLNISIVVVIALIGVFAWQIFKPSSTEVGQEETEQQNESELEEYEEGTDPNEETTSGSNEESGTNDDEDATEEEEEAREEDDEDGELEPVEDGEWEPVGTNQSGAYVHDFNKGSLNWQEKERALRYATGLSEDNMTVWFIGNGGSSHRVKGVVSDRENVDRPYEILMEFVEGEGWQPLEKKQLDSNPYR